MRKEIKTIATGSIHSFGEGFDKVIFEDNKVKNEEIYKLIKKPRRKK
jgi:hypothetical protein